MLSILMLAQVRFAVYRVLIALAGDCGNGNSLTVTRFSFLGVLTMLRQLVTFTTAIPEIVVVMTNQIGDELLNGQFLVCEIDTSTGECTECHGIMAYSQAYDRCRRSVEEIRILSTALSPDDRAW